MADEAANPVSATPAVAPQSSTPAGDAAAATAQGSAGSSGTNPSSAEASNTTSTPSLLGEPASSPDPNPESAGEKDGAAAPKPAAPSFDFSKVELPEGLALPDDAKSAIEAAFTNPDLSPEARVSSLLKYHKTQVESMVNEVHQSWTAMHKTWVDEALADKEIGGEALKTTVIPAVSKFLDAYGDPKVREALNITGAGNHPAIIRTLYRAAKALTEGGHVAGNPTGSSPKRAATTGQALYGAEGPKTTFRGE